MKKVLVASHGHLASGIRSSIEILTGMADMVEAVDCYVDDSDFTPRIQAFIDSVALRTRPSSSPTSTVAPSSRRSSSWSRRSAGSSMLPV